MNSITEHQRLLAYRNAPEDVRDVYASDKLIEHIDRLIMLFEIKMPYRAVSEIVGDYILGFYKESDLPLLCQEKFALDANQSERIALEIQNFLSLSLNVETKGTLTKKQELAQLAEQFAKPRVATPAVEEAVENTAENVTPLRTMQGDMNRIHGYGAYNEALERGEDATQAHVSSQGDILGKGK
jgi:hypothetical protein